MAAASDVLELLERHEKKELLRFVAVGSVDDGKSTLIGRLLHDAQGVYEDQLRAVKSASAKKRGGFGGAAHGPPDGTDEAGEIDFSLFTDGLKAEREQGITIDVAYRYFATAKRKFIIADTPGHVQYTRNMATGASTAQVAIILIDARLGVLPQSRRHAYIASLLGIPRLVVGVNKMDLVAWDRATYERIAREFGAFASKLGFEEVAFIPISALRGDNVATRSEAAPYYRGPTLLELLESVPVTDARDAADLRFPVQTVLRPNLDYRGYAGQIASGVVRPGDEVMVLPSRKTTRVVAVDQYGAQLAEGFAPQSVTLRLADEIDVSRGDMIVHAGRAPRVEQRFDAMLVWLHERPLDRAKSYLLKHTSQMVRADVEAIAHHVDLESLEPRPAEGLGLNDIARVTVRAHKPLFVDAYRANRATGAFILVDSLTNDTVAAGMILEPQASARAVARGELDASQVSPSERRERVGHAALAVVAKDARTAYAVERALFDRGALAAVVRGEHAVAAAGAFVDAGLVAIVLASDAGGLEDRLGPARVARLEDVDDERAAVRLLEARGAVPR
jgi:bifunctional enzyme CysN/CysC/sulfate adenylyltransferase subunit 1